MSNDNKKKKIALFACHDLIGLLMLNRIIPKITALGFEPCIFNTTNKRNCEFKTPTPAMVRRFNVEALEKVILPFLEKNHDDRIPCLSYRHLAKKHGLAYEEINDVNDPAFVSRISQDNALIGGISLRFLQVFGAGIIESFNKKGFMWNLHSGLLGKYKGLLIPYRAIANGEKEYGLTLHEITPGIDEGAILKKGILPLDPQKTVLDLYLDTVDTGAEMVIRALQSIAEGKTLPKEMQNKAEHTYYSNPTAAEFRKFVESGIFYADPLHTVQRIVDLLTGIGTKQNTLLGTEMATFFGMPLPEDAVEITAEKA